VKIPDLVAARIELHAAQTRVELEEVKAQLESERILTARSKVLRVKRDRLTEELKAWEYLAGFALLRTPMMGAHAGVHHVDSERCSRCSHLPHPDGICDVVACRCNLRDVVSEPVPSAGCTGCVHRPHAGGGCPVGTCGCVVPGIEPAQCWNCEHPHVSGERCGTVLPTESHRVCGCVVPGIEPAECENCTHRHARGDMCTVMLSGGHCGCTS
jgi:hypothetical protein